MQYVVGQIFKLPLYSRLGIVANTFSFNESNHILIYPLSNATYFAGSDDFILVCEDITTEPMMCETWNPLVVDYKYLSKSKYKGLLQEDFMGLYKKYLYYGQMGLRVPELSIFSGPPIRSNTDIRLEFRKQEFDIFVKLRENAVKKLN